MLVENTHAAPLPLVPSEATLWLISSAWLLPVPCALSVAFAAAVPLKLAQPQVCHAKLATPEP